MWCENSGRNLHFEALFSARRNRITWWIPSADNVSSILNPSCHNGPKFLETCFEVLASFQAKICTNFPGIFINSPKICTNSPKILTNFPKILTKKECCYEIFEQFSGFTMVLMVMSHNTCDPSLHGEQSNLLNCPQDPSALPLIFGHLEHHLHQALRTRQPL